MAALIEMDLELTQAENGELEWMKSLTGMSGILVISHQRAYEAWTKALAIAAKEVAKLRLCTRSIEQMCLDLNAFLQSTEAEMLT